MITLTDVTFSYGSKPILTDLNADIQPGKVTALFGPNGVGKSTLFRCILATERFRGTIECDGHSVTELDDRERARLMGYVPQEHATAFPFTVFDMVLMGRQPHTTSILGPNTTDRRIAQEALASLGLTDLAEQVYSTLSGGQRQLVLIARAIAQDAGYLLLDEPTASLDFGNQQAVWRAIRQLAADGTGVFVCAHDPNHVLWYTDDVVVLGSEGTFVDTGATRDVLTQDVLDELFPGQGTVSSVHGKPTVLPNLRADISSGA